MKLEPADIRRLLDAFENSDWNEIRLSVEGTEVFISARDDAAPPSASPRTTLTSSPVTPPAPMPVATSVAPAQPPAVEIPDGTTIRSPSPGIFWRSPAPGAPPFVDIGHHVEPDTVVCIVEVMKLMNRVSAGVRGTVIALPVANSEKVARGQPLIIVTPDPDQA